MTRSPSPSIALADLADYLDDYLDARQGGDYGPNGLQVEGRPTVRKIVTGVSACLELFERADEAEADAVLVHHGLFWGGAPQVLTGVLGRRVAALVRPGISLLAYHLPLDRHPEIGNNAVAIKGLGLQEPQPFAAHEGLPIGFTGRFARPIDADELVRRSARLFAQEPLTFLHGPDPVTSVAMVSGGAQKSFYEAIDAGIDAFITGEAAEWVVNLARESGTHYLAAGHYATERLGIRALGEHLADRFGLAVEFIDVPNPV